VGNIPYGVAVTPDGTKAYVTNAGDINIPGNTVSVINTSTNTIVTNVTVGDMPWGVAVTPDGKKVYVANHNDNNVSVIDTATNTITATVNVGDEPEAFGQFIGPMLIIPTITWNNPSDITYGTALNSTQLDATASVNGNPIPGIFTYTPGPGTVLSAGSQQMLKTTFTPTDTANYTTASASVLINVSQATPITIGSVLSTGNHILTATFTPTDTITYTPTLAWTPNPLASIVYGTPLSITQLNATATYNGQSVPGNFVYTDPIGTAETSGSGGIIQNSITVTQATPTITWSNPADICQGIPLSYDQLDAIATSSTITTSPGVSGTYYYNPNVGTVVNAGQHQPLNVTFIPVDSTDYTNASTTAYINVNRCPEKPGFFHQTEYSAWLPFQWG
jgi:YVTN family beta-propeller protein